MASSFRRVMRGYAMNSREKFYYRDVDDYERKVVLRTELTGKFYSNFIREAWMRILQSVELMVLRVRDRDG